MDEGENLPSLTPPSFFENATIAILNTAIDDFESQLEGMRRMPVWGIVVLVMTSCLCCIVGFASLTIFILLPAYKAAQLWRRRTRASRMLDGLAGKVEIATISEESKVENGETAALTKVISSTD